MWKLTCKSYGKTSGEHCHIQPEEGSMSLRISSIAVPFSTGVLTIPTPGVNQILFLPTSA